MRKSKRLKVANKKVDNSDRYYQIEYQIFNIVSRCIKNCNRYKEIPREKKRTNTVRFYLLSFNNLISSL